MNRILMTILVVLAASPGCYKLKYRFNVLDKRPATVSADYDEKWTHSFIFGLVEYPQQINLNEVCPGGVSSIEQQENIAQGLVGGLTDGIYTPREITISCLPEN